MQNIGENNADFCPYFKGKGNRKYCYKLYMDSFIFREILLNIDPNYRDDTSEDNSDRSNHTVNNSDTTNNIFNYRYRL